MSAPISRPASRSSQSPPELYSARELAAAAGVETWVISHLIASADVPTVDGEFVSDADALEAVQGVRDGRLTVHPSVARPGVLGGALLSRNISDRRSQGLSALMSTTLHAVVILVVALLTTVSLTTASDGPDLASQPQLARLIFIAAPGPGGGGGGGDYGCQSHRQWQSG